jgi:hypothetical protein
VCAELSPPTTRTRQMRHSLMMLKTFLGVIEDESGLHTVPANRAGHLPQLPQRPQPRTVVAEVAAVRRRSGRKCGQAHPADTRTSASTGTTRALRARQGNLSAPLLQRHREHQVPLQLPGSKGWLSWRASPTAPTSTCPVTRSTPAAVLRCRATAICRPWL